MKFFQCNRLDKLVSGYLLGSDVQKQVPIISQKLCQKQIVKLYIAETNLEPGIYLVFAPIEELPQTEEEAQQRVVSETLFKGGVQKFPDVEKLNQFLEENYQQIVEQPNYCLSVFVRVNRYTFCYPCTGRTHQLRIHLQFVGAPILDDPLYGGDLELIRSEMFEFDIQKSEFRQENLKALLEQELKKQKAFKLKNVKEIAESCVINSFSCQLCQVINQKPEGEILISKNGVVKNQFPFHWGQKFIRLHNFYYGLGRRVRRRNARVVRGRREHRGDNSVRETN